MRALARIVLLSLAFALATRALGWWAVPIVGFAWTVLSGGALRAPWESMLAALLGWSGILVYTAATGPLGELTRRTALLFGTIPAALVGATVLYGGLLAWSGGGIALFVPRKVKGN